MDVFSDPICPWCYIGKARLDAAIAETGRNPFRLNWRMFRLNPDMPAEGMDRQAYLEAKFGGAEGAAEVYGRIAREAAASGLDLAFDRIRRTPQTLDAHRLIRWARAEGVETPVAEQLFRRYFERGEDIGDRAVLRDIAATAGLEDDVVARLLEGDAERAELETEEEQARAMGISGVPCFVIAGRHVVQGAQDSATWARIIEELDAARAEAAG